MATMSGTVTAIRRMLRDRPLKGKLNGAIANTTTETFVVDDIGPWSVGQTWEHDDGSGEQRYVTAVTISTLTVTAERGYNGSTPTTHSDNTYLLLEPRFEYDSISQAVNTILDVDLYSNDVFEIVEHQITTSATTDTYNAPSTACERFLNIYQRPTSDVDGEPRYLVNFSRKLYNADTSLYANGKFAVIRSNYGVAGSDVYYVNCAHKLAIGTLSAAQERIVQTRAAYYLLTWSDIQRHAGPTNQGDRTVQPLSMTRLAQFYKVESERMMKEEASYLKEFINPAGGKRFIREGIR